MKTRINLISILVIFLGINAISCKRLPRCPIKSCEVRMEHPHGGGRYRGLPWWKRNQNPQYGEDVKANKDEKRKEKSTKKWRKPK
jgi:hypothetical protein